MHAFFKSAFPPDIHLVLCLTICKSLLKHHLHTVGSKIPLVTCCHFCVIVLSLYHYPTYRLFYILTLFMMSIPNWNTSPLGTGILLYFTPSCVPSTWNRRGSECLAQCGCSADICWLNETDGVSDISIIMPVLQMKKVRHRKTEELDNSPIVKIKARIQIQKPHTIFSPLSV